MPLPILIPVAIGALATLGVAKLATETYRGRPIADLAGSEWGPLNGSSDIFVAFKANGEVIGSGGCNNFFGQYTREGEQLHFGALASTRKMCAGKMEAEADWLATLQATRSAKGSHKQLTLFGESGEELIRLRRRDWD